jgi:cystathionine beta-synthase
MGLAHANLLALDRTWGGPYHRGMPPTDDLSPAQRPAVLDLIGNTPLVQVTRLDTGPCTLLLKLESQNPGGSIKDRIGRSMIEAAERDGRLKPGGTVIEATAGNTGLGLALVARAKGYRVVLVVPDKMSTEKVLHLKALGAEVHMTRSDVGKGHPAYYQDYAARLAKEIPGSFFADQFNNPANPLAHETSTGPEIWQQCGHELDAIVVGVGSAGTMTGLTRFFQRVQPQARIRSRRSGRLHPAPTTRSPAPTAQPARGRWRASAKTSSRRSPTSRR